MDTPNIIDTPFVDTTSDNKWWVLTNEENRIIMLTAMKQEDDQFEMNFPKDFDISMHNNYKVVDGELVYDEVVLPEIKPQPTLQEQIDELNVAIDTLATDVIPALMNANESSTDTES